jgi:hypothetical protein
MSWVAVAVGGAALVGAGASAYSSNKATKAGAATSQQASKDANSTQLYMYDNARADFDPFLQPSNRALAMLQSSLYGGPVAYEDASTTALSAEDLAAENWRQIQAARRADPNGLAGLSKDFWDDIEKRGEDPITRVMRTTMRGAAVPYDGSKSWYRGADGKLTSTAPPKLTASFTPQESEGFKYTKERTLSDLGRSLRMMGRGSGTVAANATGRTIGDLNAANEDKQRNELWNLVKTGQGAAGSVQSSGMNYANNVSANQMNTGNTLANLQNQNGQTQANLWAGIGGAAGNAASLYSVNKYLNK